MIKKKTVSTKIVKIGLLQSQSKRRVKGTSKRKQTMYVCMFVDLILYNCKQ